MSKCCYCGRLNEATASACSGCGTPLEITGSDGHSTQTQVVTCPNCGAADSYSQALELRSSFNLVTFLIGGLFAVMFRNASRPRRVQCSQCETVFSIRTPASKMSLAIYWLLITPGILVLGLVLYVLINAFMRG